MVRQTVLLVTVLLVEDDEDFRDTIADVLRDEGIGVQR
jgi:DNA-binding response OmpR family regulator